MSDTDEDLVPNNFKVPTQLSITKKTGYGSYNNMTTSYFNMPNQFRGFDQRSTYSIRETSPLHSFPNPGMHFQQSSYSQSAMSSRGSVYNARCRSPMSVRSIDSNASISAADIALAFKNIKFNKYDYRLIQNAYNAHMKNRMRKRIGKRRNLKSLIKHCRRKSGGESGVEGSDSSISSDGCRSTRSAFYAENMSRAQSRPPRMDLNKFTTQVRQNDIYIHSTENFEQNSFRNVMPVQSRIVNHSFMPHHNQHNVPYDDRYNEVPQPHVDQPNQVAPIVTIKDRLAKNTSSLLPFQRFNRSGANPTYEIPYKDTSKTIFKQQKESASNKRYDETDSDSDDIFPQSTSRVNLTQANTLQNKKRVLETDNSYPESKRKRISTSPEKQNKGTSSRNVKKIITKSNEFNFKKPQLPLRKFGQVIIGSEPEILIAKSSQPLVGNLEPISIKSKEVPQTLINLEEKEDTSKPAKQTSQNNTDVTHNTTDVSMKPSFMKRKLFTQKLDITENKDISNENLNSPQTKVLRACREKNKVRKLTSQSCLSHDVTSNNNHLDLIHKIVPPDQIKNLTLNKTNLANKNQANKSGIDNEAKWDVTLALSTCNGDVKSDTYTDEEIFNVPQKIKKKTQINKGTDKEPKAGASQAKNGVIATKCKVVVHKLPENFNLAENNTELKEVQRPYKRTAMSCVKSFWDTDFESDMDMEDDINLSSLRTFQKDQNSKDSKFLTNSANVFGPKKKQRGTILSLKNSQNLGMNRTTRSNVSQNPNVESILLDDEANKENISGNSMLNRSTRSCSKTKATEMQNSKDNKIDKNKLKNNSNYDSKSNAKTDKQKTPVPKKSSSTKNNKQSQSIFNISRESLRQKQKKENPAPENSPPTDGNHNVKSVSNKICNTSRESARLKEKREANRKKKCSYK